MVFRSIIFILLYFIPTSIVIAQSILPYNWTAKLEDNKLIVSGAVPSEIARVAIMNDARSAFFELTILDKMTVTSGAPENFAEAASFAVVQLDRFSSGEVKLTDKNLSISGIAKNQSDLMETMAVFGGKLPNNLILASANLKADTNFWSDGVLQSSRLFSGPTHYPPKDFKAFGIIAFPELATSASIERHIMICEAYASNIIHSWDIKNKPKDEQIVTIWPISSDTKAKELNKAPLKGTCTKAVNQYNLTMSQRAIAAVRENFKGKHDFLKRGPYLIAWAPGSKISKGTADTLVIDLSYVSSAIVAGEFFRNWNYRVETQPDVWSDGWDGESLLNLFRDWLNNTGAKVEYLIKGR